MSFVLTPRCSRRVAERALLLPGGNTAPPPSLQALLPAASRSSRCPHAVWPWTASPPPLVSGSVLYVRFPPNFLRLFSRSPTPRSTRLAPPAAVSSIRSPPYPSCWPCWAASRNWRRRCSVPSSSLRWTSSLGADLTFSFRPFVLRCFSLIFSMLCHLLSGEAEAAQGSGPIRSRRRHRLRRTGGHQLIEPVLGEAVHKRNNGAATFNQPTPGVHIGDVGELIVGDI